MPDADALFAPDGDLFVPTELARGPWDPTALHGGPIAALLARAVEACPDDGAAMVVSRLTVELLRPVPLRPLRAEGAVIRPGRKIQLVEATIVDEATGTEVARARALRIRSAAVELPEDPLLAPGPPPPGPMEATFERSEISESHVAFHNSGSEHRFLAGTWNEAGPVTVWIRLLAPVVAGEEASPLQRVVAAADFANGIARVLPWDDYVFINADLTVHLHRVPRGEWILLDSRSFIGPYGVGMAESVLADADGCIGRSVQSLLVDAR
jgi:uncharacterized protein (TIGR00369 family)